MGLYSRVYCDDLLFNGFVCWLDMLGEGGEGLFAGEGVEIG